MSTFHVDVVICCFAVIHAEIVTKIVVHPDIVRLSMIHAEIVTKGVRFMLML